MASSSGSAGRGETSWHRTGDAAGGAAASSAALDVHGIGRQLPACTTGSSAEMSAITNLGRLGSRASVNRTPALI